MAKKVKTKTCKYCKLEIPEYAKVCPFCHKKQKGNFMKHIVNAIKKLLRLAI